MIRDKRYIKKEFCRMRRPCDRCDEYFIPSTKGTRMCDKCHLKSSKDRLEKNRLTREKNKKKSI